jgi:hypothetical protein
MIIHVVSMITVLVDSVTQAPVIVWCAQVVPELWWKWLLQFALSIVPVAGGVGIAWMAFRWNRQKEHKQWVLDQKKSEWRELFSAFAELRKEFLPLYKDKETATAFVEKWDEIESTIDSIATMPLIFLAQELIDRGFIRDWQVFKDKGFNDRIAMSQLIKDYVPRTLYTMNQTQSVACEL